MGIEVPEELGGLGQGFTTSIAVIEALRREVATRGLVDLVQDRLFGDIEGVDVSTEDVD